VDVAADAVPGGCAGNVNAPPMGQRIRLKAAFDITGYMPTAQAFRNSSTIIYGA